jgi:GT2 family glycosyltransferase
VTDGPLAVTEVDLGLELDDIALGRRDGVAFEAARVLVRMHHVPVGFVDAPIDDGVVRRAALTAIVRRELNDAISTHACADGIEWDGNLSALTTSSDCAACPPLERHPSISVVVCTRERPDELARCLTSLRLVRYPNVEFVVVDNAPASARTATVVRDAQVEDARVKLVTEPRPGLSRARNAGVAESTGELVAFTDDDVRVDQWWLEGLARGFARQASVGCVTGLVPAAELATAAQRHFDRRVFWSASCVPRLVDAGANRPASPLFPYAAGQLGTGASMAFRRAVLDAIGPFDEALGAGSAAQGGEDLDAFVRVILGGWAVAYEPTAIAWHVHRGEMDSLRAQLYGYGKGLTAYLTKQMSDPKRAWDIARQAPRGIGYAKSLLSRPGSTGTRGRDSRALRVAELAGMAAGPAAYLRGRWAMTTAGR